MSEDVLSRKLWKFEIAECILIIMILTYSVIFSYYTILRHYSFRSNAWDLGILVQSVATAAKGLLFKNNAELYFSPSGCYFGVHFTPILFVVVPFFFLINKVETILVIQSIILALSVVPIYLLTRHYFNHRFSSLLISASYLINPLLHGINWYDFHTQAFFPLFILSSNYFWKKRKHLLYILFITLALTTMEQSSYFVMLYLVSSCWEMKKELIELIRDKKISSSSLTLIISFLIVIFWIIFSSNVQNIINPNPPKELTAIDNYKILDIKHLAEIPIKVIVNPRLALKAIRYDLSNKILYILFTFAPSCFLAILSPLTLLPSLLWLFLSILSNWGPYYQMGFQYTAFTLPFVSIATLETIHNFNDIINEKSRKKFLNRISTTILVVGLFITICGSPLSFIHKYGDYTYFRDFGISTPSSLDNKVLAVLRTLPKDSRILTTATIFPHLSTYTNTYVIPPLNSPTPRLFKGNINYLKSINYDYILLTSFWDKNEAELIHNNFISEYNVYNLFIKGPGIELYKRDYRGPPAKISLKFSYKELFTPDSIIIKDPSSTSGNVIFLETSSQKGRYAWFGPYITLVPGNYTLIFKIKIDHLLDEKIMTIDVWSNSLESTLASFNLYGKYFHKQLTWHTFSLELSITERTSEIEFRGYDVNKNVSISLDYIEVIH